jgi:hypothetical protein
MGKSQKKKAMRRHNPMRVPDSHLPTGLASASKSSSRTNEILPIIQKVISGNHGKKNPENDEPSSVRWEVLMARIANGLV